MELLAVIALLLILLSLLMPAFGRARDAARQVQCSAKLRGIGAGLMLFLSDHQVYPLAVVDNSVHQMQDSTWGEQLYPYIFVGKAPPNRAVGSTEFSCPAAPQKFGGRFRNSYMISSDKGTPNDPPKKWKDRGIDVSFFNSPGFSRNRQGRLLAAGEVLAPADTFFVVDGIASRWTFLESNTLRIGHPNEILDLGVNDGIEPHNSANNWLFCDGHVKRMNLVDTIGTGSLGMPYGIWTRDDND